MGESHVTPADPKPKRETAAKLTGLTYRQLNEWDKRDLLPHTRTGETGWRRVTQWQAISIRIAAELHSGFGIPLARLQGLLQWLTGEVPLAGGASDMEAAAALACLVQPLSGAEGAGSHEDRQQIQSRLSAHLKLSRDEDDEDASHIADEMLSELAGAMSSRGCDWERAREFAATAFSLTAPGNRGAEISDQLYELELAALSFGDLGAKQAARLLSSLLIPVSAAVMRVSTGFPSYFITDLTRGVFVTEPYLLEMTIAGEEWRSSVVLPATEHVNSVWEALGRETFPVTKRVRDIHAVVQEAGAERILTILDLLRAA